MNYEELLRYGGNTATLLHPVTLAFALVAGGLVCGMSRKYLLVPMIAALVLLPTGQRLVLAGVDMTIYRILLLCAWLRLFSKGEHRSIELNGIDRAVLWWVTAAVVTYTMLWSNVGALVNRLGLAFDIFGTYFLVRVVVDDQKGVERVIKALVGVAVLVGLLMVVEATMNRNPFAELGGVPAVPETREGRVRAQGSFNHPILAGTFGATLLPLSMALWWRGQRKLGSVGAVTGVVITWASGSSGPVLSLATGIVGLMMWPMRDHMTWVRRAIVVLLIALHMVMKDPVWALPSRLDVFAGSTGYHRFFLIDNFIRRFDEWFLMGVRLTASWGFLLQDHTNQFVAVGTSGGLVTLILFILVIKRSFAGLQRARSLSSGNTRQQRALWAMSSTLTAHLVTFIGVSYFGQMADLWYLFLGLTSAASAIAVKQASTPRQDPLLPSEAVHA